MSNQSNRGGMGSHKHYISGHVRPTARHKQQQAREVNAELDHRRGWRQARIDDTYDTVQELFRRQRSKRRK